MYPIKDETGNKYGKLTVVGRAGSYVFGNKQAKATWWCKCECGNTVELRGARLRAGLSHCCGWKCPLRCESLAEHKAKK
jgi:hypothetical protein